MTFKIGDWVKSARIGSKGSFVAQIVERSGADFIIKDAERRRWLRTREELSHVEKENA